MSTSCGVGFVEPDSSDVAVCQRKKLYALLAGRIRATPRSRMIGQRPDGRVPRRCRHIVSIGKHGSFTYIARGHGHGLRRVVCAVEGAGVSRPILERTTRRRAGGDVYFRRVGVAAGPAAVYHRQGVGDGDAEHGGYGNIAGGHRNDLRDIVSPIHQTRIARPIQESAGRRRNGGNSDLLRVGVTSCPRAVIDRQRKQVRACGRINTKNKPVSRGNVGNAYQIRIRRINWRPCQDSKIARFGS